MKRHGGPTARVASKYAKHLLAGAASIATSKYIDRVMAPVPKHHHHKGTGAGKSSAGDLSKVEYKKHGSKRQLKKKMAFKKKVEAALESDMPLIKTVS